VPWAWSSFGVYRFHQAPFSGGDAVSMEVVNSVVAIITSKDVYASVVHDCCVTVSGGRWLRAACRNNFNPVVGLEVESEKVIAAISTVISPKYIEVVFHSNRSVKRSWTRRMAFIGLLGFNLMPSIRFLKKVVFRTSNDILAIERVLIKSSSATRKRSC
jgi:hypothetical protein